MSRKKPNNFYRFISVNKMMDGTMTDYRSEFARDYARVLHSPSFRRLQNKTQLFPAQENDFFRNRLTHSLEVSQIAKSIAYKLLKENKNLDLFPDVCEIAGLLHDIGHPPFGHNGEAALDDCMRHCGGFEGNAQTIRVITRLEKKERRKLLVDEKDDYRVGLNLTARVIASTLKYDCEIPNYREDDVELVKGYYSSEKAIIDKVKDVIIGRNTVADNSFKTIECSIMDLADDIAYSTYDLEDAFKANFLTPFDILSVDDEIIEKIIIKMKRNGIEDINKIEDCRGLLYALFQEIWKDIYEGQDTEDELDNKGKEFIQNALIAYTISKKLSNDGYERTKFTSKLVNMFINGIKVEINEKIPVLSKVYFDDITLKRVSALKHLSYICLINSSRLKVAENRGKEIVQKLFERIKSGGTLYLPEDYRELYKLKPEDDSWHSRVVCDFIAGMTDRYALEFYGRLFSENPQTIFKPL